MVRFLTFCLAGLLAVAVSAQDKPQDKAAEFKTVTTGDFTFSYKVDQQNLVGKISCQTKGWISIGFNPTTVMKNANIIIGYADSSKSFVEDQFGTGMFEHKADTTIGGKNNIIDGKCTQESGITTLLFTIPLDSGDPYDGKIVPGQKTKVIFACGKTNDIKSKHNKVAKTEVMF